MNFDLLLGPVQEVGLQEQPRREGAGMGVSPARDLPLGPETPTVPTEMR